MQFDRKSNYELLRIFSMTLIIMAHYVYHGGLLFHSSGINYFLAELLKPGGNFGVICFVLISAYFGRHFKTKRILNVSLQTMVVSLLLSIWGKICGGGKM